MQFRFLHAADIHLGHEQYGLAKRSNDFAKAYLGMVDYAVHTRVDFVLIAGDLFHHARADAWTLKQAIAGLTILREAQIPVLAVEGNHDAQHVYKNLSWMEFLCDQELLILLNMHKAPNGYKSMVPFDQETRRGSWIDVAGARVYGLKYYGASTARIIEEIAGDVEREPNGYTIMMLHAGMEGQVPQMHGGLTFGQLEPLRASVDYLALGHIHKRLVEGWVFNPGSTETNSVDEMEWDHGFFDLSVDTESDPKQRVEAIPTDTLRPFRRIVVTADGTETLGEFVSEVESRVEQHRAIPAGAVIELALGGIAGFRRQDIPLERLKAAVERRFAPLVVRVRNSLAPPGLVAASGRERLTRADLERRVVGQLVNQMAEYRPMSEEWTRLILDIKNMAVEKDLPASITDHVRDSLRAMQVSEPQPVAEPEAQDIEFDEPATTPLGI
jgi:DNA repair exonuclease SbcCD nuclease subunit